LQRVLIVAEDDIQIGLIEDEAKELHRVARYANEADFALFLHFAQGGNRFINDLLHGHELDVVTETNIEVLHAKPVQADIHALEDALGGEIEVVQIVAAKLGGDQIAVARGLAQRHAKQHLAHAASVKWGSVDEVHASLEGYMNGAKGFGEVHFAEFLAERRGAKADDRKFEAGLAEHACLHGVD
jgi:hypothetical protein